MKKRRKRMEKEVANMVSLEKEIKKKNILPESEKRELYRDVFKNILIASIMMLYFIFLILGAFHIEPEVYEVDLKVFSIGLIILTVLLFEMGYRKNNAKLAIHGIESFFIALISLISTYLYYMLVDKYNFILATCSFLFAIYYGIKSALIYRKGKKVYIRKQNDINEIVKGK